MIPESLIAAYNVPVPRYTSYPPASVWGRMGEEEFRGALSQRSPSAHISLYVHVPFCRSICAYCGCSCLPNKRPEVNESYANALLREIGLVTALTGPLRVCQLHFGGGTPTSLSTPQLAAIVAAVRRTCLLNDGAELSIEIDPRTVDASILGELKELGFTRVSLGIQDLNEEVQKAIGRHQSEQTSRSILNCCRSLKFSSINVDLVYGLPCQTAQNFQATIDKVISLRPDRIALFSFAYLPTLRANQRSLPAKLLPTPVEKFHLFLTAREQLIRSGYIAVGLDHFSLPSDPLSNSLNLHRSFQGYSEQGEVLGLGMTSISSLEAGYFQNEKSLPTYLQALSSGKLATCRGAQITSDDQKRRDVIDHIMCRCRCSKKDFEDRWHESFDQYFHSSLNRLLPLVRDGLVELTDGEIIVTTMGRLFLRSIAACFDATLPPIACEAI